MPHRSHRKSSILAHFSWNWLLVLLLVSRGYEGSAQAPAEKEESPKIGSAKRILAIDEKTLGPDDPELAKSLNRLAALYQEAGNFAKAEPLFQRVLRINEKALGSEHPDTAESLNNLATLYHAMGDYAKAEPPFQRALKIREKLLGPEHPDTAVSLNNLAMLYRAMGEYGKAEPLFERALKIKEKRSHQGIPIPH